MCDKCVQICNAIGQLREDEGDSVTIFSDNPDYFTKENSAITVCGQWTNWKEKRFPGNSVLECLENALKEK